MTYTELKAAVATYMHRTDLTAVTPTFIQLAESSLFRELSPPETEEIVAGVTVGGYAVLPADFGTLQKLTVTTGGITRDLSYISLANVGTVGSSYPASCARTQRSLRGLARERRPLFLLAARCKRCPD